MTIIQNWIKKKRRLHFTLIDPDKQTPNEAGLLAKQCASYGTDAIMVGGSTVEGRVVDETVAEVKKACRLPVILFPSTAAGVSPRADYIFWMMLLNSTSRRFLVGEQVKAAVPLSRTKVKPISMGYIVISTSSKPTAVERVGLAERIDGADIESAVAHALAAQYFGMECVYLEAGSGAEKPIPEVMVRKVKQAISIPLIVGGGIRTPEAAKRIVKSGADVVVTGTIAERNPEVIAGIIRAVKGRRFLKAE
jgi:phosphoglycerol geranylgeranyltransferase